MPILVESSSSSALKYGMPERDAMKPETIKSISGKASIFKILNPVKAKMAP